MFSEHVVKTKYSLVVQYSVEIMNTDGANRRPIDPSAMIPIDYEKGWMVLPEIRKSSRRTLRKGILLLSKKLHTLMGENSHRKGFESIRGLFDSCGLARQNGQQSERTAHATLWHISNLIELISLGMVTGLMNLPFLQRTLRG